MDLPPDPPSKNTSSSTNKKKILRVFSTDNRAKEYKKLNKIEDTGDNKEVKNELSVISDYVITQEVFNITKDKKYRRAYKRIARDLRKQFHAAIREGNIEAITKCLNDEPELVNISHKALYPVVLAMYAQKDPLAVVKTLLSFNPRLDVPNVFFHKNIHEPEIRSCVGLALKKKSYDIAAAIIDKNGLLFVHEQEAYGREFITILTSKKILN
jgi:hypothetical protein